MSNLAIALSALETYGQLQPVAPSGPTASSDPRLGSARQAAGQAADGLPRQARCQRRKHFARLLRFLFYHRFLFLRRSPAPLPSPVALPPPAPLRPPDGLLSQVLLLSPVPLSQLVPNLPLVALLPAFPLLPAVPLLPEVPLIPPVPLFPPVPLLPAVPLLPVVLSSRRFLFSRGLFYPGGPSFSPDHSSAACPPTPAHVGYFAISAIGPNSTPRPIRTIHCEVASSGAVCTGEEPYGYCLEHLWEVLPEGHFTQDLVERYYFEGHRHIMAVRCPERCGATPILP